MNNQRKVFSRREMLEISLGIGGLTALGDSAFAQEAKRLITPEAVVGPFYPVLKPLAEYSWKWVRIKGRLLPS